MKLMWSPANYWIGLALDFIVSLAVLAFTFAPTAAWLVQLLAGLITFTFYEYAIHRWLYHGRGYVGAIHAQHHADADRLNGAPIYFSLGIAAIHALVFGPVFAAGLLFGYAQQSAIHHCEHAWPYSFGMLARSRLRKHHLRHHHDAATNFGISTLVWDHVFGTRRARTASTNISHVSSTGTSNFLHTTSMLPLRQNPSGQPTSSLPERA